MPLLYIQGIQLVVLAHITAKYGRHSCAGAGAADRWSCGCVSSTRGMLAARAALLTQRQHLRVHGPQVDKDVLHAGPAHNGRAGE